MALYDRMIKRVATTALPAFWPELFAAVLQEYALGKMTDAQAIAVLGLDTAEAAQAVLVKNAIVNGNAALSGPTPWARLQEVSNVLLLASLEAAPLNTLVGVTTRLGL